MKLLAVLLLAAPHYQVAVTPGAITIATGPCNGGVVQVRLTNPGPAPLYADAELSADDALHLPRRLISTWLPAGYTRVVPVTVSSAVQGAYRIRVTGAGKRIEVPVTVTAPRPSANLARTASHVAASTVRAGQLVCAALDGDPLTWWADGTGREWPDWYQLKWDAPQQIRRVVLATTTTTTAAGLRDWDVQVSAAGQQWRTVAQVRGNTLASRVSEFAAQRADALRIVTYAAKAPNDQSRIAELTVS